MSHEVQVGVVLHCPAGTELKTDLEGKPVGVVLPDGKVVKVYAAFELHDPRNPQGDPVELSSSDLDALGVLYHYV